MTLFIMSIYFITHYFQLLNISKISNDIFDIKFIPIHGGSIRFYVCNSNSYRAKKITNAVKLLEKRKRGYNKFVNFQKFSKNLKIKIKLITLLKNLKSKGFTVAVGASEELIQLFNIVV